MPREVMVMGASAGGVEALREIVADLPADLPAAVLVVLHSSPEGPYLLPKILEAAGALEVEETTDGAAIEPGKVYVARPDHHLLVKGRRLRVVKGPKENNARPAIDPLFRTAALHYGPRVVGVILTGMLDDGTAGLAAVKERGGLAVVQDPAQALYPSMPHSALRHVGVDHVARVADIAPLLTRVVSEPVTSGELPPVSRRMEVESRFDEMEAPTMEKLDGIGSRAGLTCPECHGPLWKVGDPTMDRFRCLVGHAYSPQTMVGAQLESQETYLWQALRLMKERASLIFELRAHAEDRRSEEERVTYEAQLGQLQKDIATIEAMLE